MTSINTNEKYYWLNDISREFLSKGYLVNGQSAEDRIKEIAQTAERYLGQEGFAAKFEDYMSRGFYSLATPVWCNYGNSRGLPISCFGSFIEDDMASILFTQAEVGMMSKYGGGTSGYFGQLRHRGAEIRNNGVSSGAVHFMELFDKITDVVSQGSSRRGAFAPYLDIEHGDIKEFLKIGTEGHSIQKLTHGVCVGDQWMQEMIDGDTDKRAIWAEVLKSRSEVWYPYLFFKDTVNTNKPECYANSTITHSNLCSEIALPDSKDESFVCCLSSLNLLHWDRIKETDAVETLIYFLDTVIEDFIQKLDAETDPLKRTFMQRPLQFAKRHRALGLGVIGWHSYLQDHMIAFESQQARDLNNEIYQMLKTKTTAASQELARQFGESEMTSGTGRRNTTLMAIAPTTSSAFILGQVSQSIEPYWSNYYIKDTAKVKNTFKNPYLERELEKLGYNTPEVWDLIKQADGSVQHLDFLSDDFKAIFKTFGEIDQYVIIDQAADRQRYIDQGQSLNILVPGTMPAKEINKLHIYAWQQGVKALYYQHSFNAAQVAKRKKVSCVGCES